MATKRVDLGDCRFYENRFPKVDDLVMVIVRRIAEMGAYVTLNEYNEVEGMILMSELSKRRFRSVAKLVKPGKHEVVMVLRTDEDKGYIDLSKRRVSPEDIAKCEEKYSKSKAVQTIIRHLATTFHKTVESLNREITWPLAKKYGHEYEAFKEAAVNPDKVLGELDVSPEVRDALVQDIKRRLTPQAVRLRARVEVMCFGYEGVEAVKEALLRGKTVSDEENEVTIKLVAPPQYVIDTTCNDKEAGTKKINQAIELIKEHIQAKKGTFKLASAITIVGGEEDKRLEELLAAEGEDDDSDASDEEDEEEIGMGEVGDDVPDDEGVRSDDN